MGDYKKRMLDPSNRRSTNIEDRRGWGPKDEMAYALDRQFDRNKRGEPGARRRKIHTPDWYDEERRNRYKK